MRCRKASSPSMTCVLMANASSFQPRPAPAHLCKWTDRRDPHLCKATSTFPPMTARPVSSILGSNQVSRAAYGLIRKGRYDDQTSPNMGATGQGRRHPLRLLRCIAPDCGQLQPGMVAGIPKESGHDWRGKPLPGLPPEPQRSSHRGARQRSHVRPTLAFHTLGGPVLPRNPVFHREGKRQGISLVGPSLAVRANGRRNDL